MNSRVWTKILTNNTLIITEAMGFTSISFILTSGAATVQGDLNVPSASDAVNMVIGLPVAFSSKSQSPLTGITIDASAGTVEFLGQQ